MRKIFSFITAILAMIIICYAQANRWPSNLTSPIANVNLLPGGMEQLSSQTTDSVKVVISHIFFCIDSISYENLFKHKFISKIFANTVEATSKTATESWTGKYLMGRQSYIEVFAANYKGTSSELGNKFGDAGIVFRTRKPSDIHKINARIKADKHDAHLEVMKYESNGKIIPFNYNLYISSADLQETFHPYIEELTEEFLKLCGFSEGEIKAGITEEQFREKRSGKKYEKLYDNIEKIELTLTSEEFAYLAETLKYIGFSQEGHRLTNDRLEILCSLQQNRSYKLKAIHFALHNETEDVTIEISKNLTFKANGTKACFQFNY